MAGNAQERDSGPNSEKLPLGEVRRDDRGLDEQLEEVEEGVGLGESRPLTREEREAAKRDKGPANTVFAPASERVAKQPLPEDEKFINQTERDQDKDAG